ncbi:8-oxo-dGTP diphosphatase [Bacillus sp. 2205SS5-2]|uniref:8-oxo-dGTP diphosphatase n=1 Tax=Bacillus sp. 2205SS5-2 TaxID=3109031 RepID=UPI003FA5305E
MRVKESIRLYTIVMIQRDDEVLLMNRPDSKGFPGYIAPGGKIDFPENPAVGAIREVKEETGLEVKSLIFKGISEFVNEKEAERYMVFNYLATKVEGQILDNPPEGELTWVKREEATTLPMQSWFKHRFPYFFQEETFEIYRSWSGIEHEKAKEYIRES